MSLKFGVYLLLSALLIIHQVEAVREDIQGECSVDSTIPSVMYEINK
jgi:hypothetical protein